MVTVPIRIKAQNGVIWRFFEYVGDYDGVMSYIMGVQMCTFFERSAKEVAGYFWSYLRNYFYCLMALWKTSKSYDCRPPAADSR